MKEDLGYGGRWRGKVFVALCIAASFVGIVALSGLLVYVFWDAVGWVDWQFLTSPPSRFAKEAGIYPALVGSVFVISLVAFLSLPLGVGAAIFLEEYSSESPLLSLLETNISNLAGVPSIVFGLLGLGVFVNLVGLRYGTIVVGALTLTLLILPIVIVSAQEAIRSVPDSHRRASFGIGATRWQTIKNVVLPQAVPGIMTGTILALARAMGETAPLIMIGFATAIFRPPSGLFSATSAMPLQIFAWSDLPGESFQHGVTPAGIVVLLLILLAMNGTAVLVRKRYERS